MSDTYRAVIPYESMDPLAIGATDDESKKHRDTLEVEIRGKRLVGTIVGFPFWKQGTVKR